MDSIKTKGEYHIYLAAPLFTLGEQDFNCKLCKHLEDRNYRVFSPQK